MGGLAWSAGARNVPRIPSSVGVDVKVRGCLESLEPVILVVEELHSSYHNDWETRLVCYRAHAW